MKTFRVKYLVNSINYTKFFNVPSMINHYGNGSTEQRLTQLFQNILGGVSIIQIDFVNENENKTGEATVVWDVNGADYKIVGQQGWIREAVA